MSAPRRLATAAAVLVTAAAAAVACSMPDAMPQADGTRPGLAAPAARVPAGRAAQPRPQPLSLTTAHARTSRKVVAQGGGDSKYNYAPAVLVDGGGTVRLWWCSQLGSAGPPGDDILFAQSKSINGPFRAGGRSAVAVFSGSTNGFDAVHTCDPSVVVQGGTYYLYYTGAAGAHAHGNAIGLASSPDGLHWKRANGGRPILTASGAAPKANTYGLGQPSVLVQGGWFYLMYTDTTEPGAGPNGAGQFVLRAHDPAFTADVQALTANGFRPVADHPARLSIVDAFSADWMWVDAMGAFAVAHETADGTTVTFLGPDLLSRPYRPVVIRGRWQEGPGLLRRPDGHAVVAPDDPCNRVPLDVLRATSNAAAPTNMVHFGLDVTGADGCGTRDRALATLYGYAVPSPQRTMDLVASGGLVRIDRRSVAQLLAARILDHPVPALADAPVVAHLPPSVPARSAPGRGFGLLLDDGRLWRIPSAAVATANSSPVLTVAPAEFDSYPGGAMLALR